MGVNKERLKAFSFTLAVVLTPPVIVREVRKLLKVQQKSSSYQRYSSRFGTSLSSWITGNGIKLPGRTTCP